MGNQEIKDAYFDLENKVAWEDNGGYFWYYNAGGLFVFRDKVTAVYLFVEADTKEEALLKIQKMDDENRRR